MKKVSIALLISFFLLGSVSVYAFTSSGTNLSLWYKNAFDEVKNKAATTVKEGIFTLEVSVSQQKEASIRKIEKDLDDFIWTSTTDVKSDLENHQEAYITKLTETKEMLKNRDYEAYEKRKKEEIELEIKQDVEDFLKELLSE